MERQGIGGYIVEGGCRHFVAVMDKKRHDALQKGAAPIKVQFDNIECANHRRQPVESELTADTEADWQA